MLALLVYLLFGLSLAWAALPCLRRPVKCWMGLTFGCVALMWLPCLPAFFLGFTRAAQYTALGAALLGTAALAALTLRRKKTAAAPASLSPAPAGRDALGLLLSLAACCFCVYLLHTHVLLPHDDGSLWVGQCTYGDLAMHLGFAESLYQQGFFPPEYSIYPGQMLDYPFLVDAASASLRFFGLSLRMSVIVPSAVFLLCVFWGFWLLADRLTGRTAPTLMAWLLFVCNGGFGFTLFLTGKYSLADLMGGFYITPTNLVDEDIRWVNVICDMLIPQRTTMAGWCACIPALYLLITAVEKTLRDGSGRREFLALGVLAGTMPMIHTHSFLALGVLSGGWFFAFLGKARKNGRLKALIENYVLYGVVCMVLALPQLITWTFDAAGSGNLLRLYPGWVHGQMNWLWFWIYNCGVVFCLMLPMMFFLRGDRARLFWGAAALFALANLVLFAPNPYDNNKLLYIWYMVVDILVCAWTWELLERLRRPAAAAAVSAVLVLAGGLSGVMSMCREAVSGYQLFSAEQVQAASFVLDNTDPDSVFLTCTDHTDPIPVLTGRNILCGSSLYLYYHGVDYQDREAQLPVMYAGGEGFEKYAEQYGVDYVYIGNGERQHYQVNEAYFSENYPCVYDQGGISIFQIRS